MAAKLVLPFVLKFVVLEWKFWLLRFPGPEEDDAAVGGVKPVLEGEVCEVPLLDWLEEKWGFGEALGGAEPFDCCC